MSELDARVKELNCLFEISRLIEKRELSLDDLLQGIADLMPPAWQYPDIACAKIELNGKELKTHNFEETIWEQIPANTWGDHNIVQPGRFVSPNGEIRLRLENNSQQGTIDIEATDFTLIVE